ncbi:RNA 2'-phosphotransferase [Priestia megaterium]|uniref:RNA 2'-phosphotransferase n=1 Tax=Priestia megaterium TaxID=1404 RepID=UPI00112E9DC3|nr:RNA 2'-phosphotransferase [Priestia megaterium]TPF17985.1 RNA 2'-phosphotransferase [Priestia megaterium]TPF22093.1 RNA 2'-phosphotransferase [Priestia megaterium]
MSNKNDKLSVFISLILRHKPEAANIQLDEFGYANVDELIKGVNETGRRINLNILKEIVSDDKKGRYSFNESFTLIRANQGHSINVKVPLQKLEPPQFLYHGTAERFLDSILNSGVKKMNRLYVHLSDNLDTAKQVGKRHGKPVILTVDAQEMHKDGYEFYLSENKVWLTDFVPTKYVKLT